MALSFDDRLLGEKVHNYCSSSDGEGNESDSAGESDGEDVGPHEDVPPNTPAPPFGNGPQTGPKGVLEDYRQYKNIEYLKAVAQQQELLNLSKKCTLTCRPYSADVKAQQEEIELQQFLESLEDDSEFLNEYRERRLREMQEATLNLPKFGQLFHLNAENFVEEIDNVSAKTTVIVHVYEERVKACETTDTRFSELCKLYRYVKFCRLRAAHTLSRNFSANGVPAILVYKAGELIGNFIKISKHLGDEFTTESLEQFLLEHGLLPPRPSTASNVAHRCRRVSKTQNALSSSDSD